MLELHMSHLIKCSQKRAISHSPPTFLLLEALVNYISITLHNKHKATSNAIASTSLGYHAFLPSCALFTKMHKGGMAKPLLSYKVS